MMCFLILLLKVVDEIEMCWLMCMVVRFLGVMLNFV